MNDQTNNQINQNIEKAYEYAAFINPSHFDLPKEYLNFNQKLLTSPSKDIYDLIYSYKYMGCQAKKIHRAYEIIRKMINEKNKISLSITSNALMANRLYINFLIQNNIINCLITTCGAFEEDTMNDIYGSHFFIGEDFWRNGSLQDDIKLKNLGINRNGDVLIPNQYYATLWEHISNNIDISNIGKNFSFTDLYKEIIKTLSLSKNSVFKNLVDNKVKFFIPAPTDGALGDFILFEKIYKNKEYHPSLSKDYYDMANFYIENQDNISVIILGAGVSKHHNLLHSIYARGAKNAVYINTSEEYDNSDSGAPPNEAITWGKLRTNANFVKVHSEISTCFPLIVEALRYEFNLV